MNLENYDDYESFNDYAIDTITYKSKTLDDWSDQLLMPEYDLQSLDQVEQYNQKAIRMTELVATHTSLTKSAYYLAKASFTQKLHTEKMNVSDESSKEVGKRLPSADTLERLAMDRSLKEWRIMVKAEIIFEFWNTHSFKMNAINSRLTSLNILKSIESKTSGY